MNFEKKWLNDSGRRMQLAPFLHCTASRQRNGKGAVKMAMEWEMVFMAGLALLTKEKSSEFSVGETDGFAQNNNYCNNKMGEMCCMSCIFFC